MVGLKAAGASPRPTEERGSGAAGTSSGGSKPPPYEENAGDSGERGVEDVAPYMERGKAGRREKYTAIQRTKN